MTFPVPIDASWRLIFDDEFNGAALNPAKWNTGWFGSGVTRPVNGSETAAYDPACVSVSGGALRLQLLPKSATVGGTTFNRSAGMVCTHGANWSTPWKFSYRAGMYVEAKITLAAAADGRIANWPQFWTDGQNWPGDGEIDVFEGLGGGLQWHWHGANWDPGGGIPGDWRGAHRYGCLRQPGKLSFVFDDRVVATLTDNRIGTSPHFIILAHGAGNYGGPDLAPSEMAVEYVRCWSNDPAAVAVTPEPGFDVTTPPSPPAPPAPPSPPPPTDEISALKARMGAVEADVEKLKLDAAGLATRLKKYDDAG